MCAQRSRNFERNRRCRVRLLTENEKRTHDDIRTPYCVGRVSYDCAGRREETYTIIPDNHLAITNSPRQILYIVRSVGDNEKPADQNRANPKCIPTTCHTSIGFAFKDFSDDQNRIGFDYFRESPSHNYLALEVEIKSRNLKSTIKNQRLRREMRFDQKRNT